MKAAVLYEAKKPLVVEDVEIGEPKAGEVLVKGASAGVCHSDLHFMERLGPSLCASNPAGSMKDGTSRLKKGYQSIFHFLGVSSFAQYLVAHETAMVKVRQDAPLEKVALIGCGVMTGVGAVINTAKVEMGSSVAVFGCGGGGLHVLTGGNLAA